MDKKVNGEPFNSEELPSSSIHTEFLFASNAFSGHQAIAYAA